MKNHTKMFACLLAFVLTPVFCYGQNIQIFNGSDVNFGTWLPGDGGQTSDQFFCVFKDSGNDRWDAVAIGSGAGNAFELTNINSDVLPLQRVRVAGTDLSPGVTETNFPDADNSGSADCAEFGGDNQQLRVQLQNATLGSTPPGLYTGTLMISVMP